MTITDADWRLIREEVVGGASSFARDEIAARTAAEEGLGTVRLYQWLPACLSLGYRQDPETVNWEFCESQGIDVVRRPTGGGGIYHDTHGDIAYSIIAPADAVPGDLEETYELFCEPLFDAFEELGVPATFAEEPAEALYEPSCYLREVDPTHDIVVGGRKLAGNAQYRTRDAVVQHGSISFEVDAERHLSCFADPPVDAEGFRERVGALNPHANTERDTPIDSEHVGLTDSFNLERDRAVRVIEENLGAWCGATDGDEWVDDEWTDGERTAAAALADEKYRSEAWTRDREDPTDD
jgi:lipoate-protein ligase A